MASSPTPTLEPIVLGYLLNKLNLGVNPESLAIACSKADPKQDVLKQLGQVLERLDRTQVKAAFMPWNRFDARHLPALFWYQDKWQLAEAAGGENIQLTAIDSETKAPILQTLTMGDIENCKVLWLKRSDQVSQPTKAQQKRPALSLLLNALTERKGWLGHVILATVVINLIAVTTSLFAMHVYDRVVPSFAYATLWTLVAGMGLVIFLDWCLKLLRSGILDRMSKYVDQKVSQQLFDRLTHLRQDSRPEGIGTLAAQVNALEGARGFLSSAIVFTLTDLPFALFFITMISIIGGDIAWVYVVLLPVALIIGLISQARLRVLSEREQQRSQQRQGLLVDSIRGSETIVSTGSDWVFAESWREMTSDIAGYNLKSRRITTLTQTTAGSMGTIAYVSAIVIGVGLIETGAITMGAMIACTILGGRVLGPVTQSIQLLMQWQHAREGLKMVDQLLEAPQHRTSDQQLLSPSHLGNSIELKDIQFSYGDVPVLRVDIPTLNLKPGDRVAIVGNNGSGKSTLMKLLSGVYYPTKGSIRIGDADLWQLDPQLLQQRIGYLPQSIHLFKGTLRSNLTLSGRVNDDKLLTTIKMLGIDQIVKDNPKGLELPIAEGGAGLSGGQQQLLAIGRIALTQPKIWLMDEPTANLDEAAEKRVVEVLKRMIRPDDILIFTTHRQQVMQLANRMIAMKSGRVVLDDKPQTIMQKLSERRKPRASIDATKKEEA